VNALLLLATWLVVSPAGDRVSVAWEWPGEAYEVDARTGRVTGKGRLPAAGPGYRLDRFAGTLTFTGPKPVALRLCREPYAAAATPDGRQIFVACLLPEQAMLDPMWPPA